MEKIRSLLSPGKQTDDEVMYGSGISSDPVHSGTGNTGSLSGEGSHLGGHTRGTTAGTGNTGTLSGEGSHLEDRTRNTTAGTGVGTSNTGGAQTTAGPHASNLENKVDPRVASDLNGSRTLGGHSAAAGNTGYGSAGNFGMPGTFETESNNPYNSRHIDPRVGGIDTTGTSITGTSTSGNTSHLGRDAAIGAGGVGLAEREHRKHEGTADYGSTGSGVGNTSSTTGTSYGSGNTSGQSATGRTDTGHTSHSARNGATGAGGIGLAEHERLKHDGHTGYGSAGSGVGSAGSRTDTGYGSTRPTNVGIGHPTGQGLPDRTSDTSGHHLGRDVAAVGGVAAVGEGRHHHHDESREAVGSTGYGGTNLSGSGTSYYGAPTGAAIGGPHETATANRLDPYVNRNAAPIEDASVHDRATGGGAESADVAHGRNPETAAIGAIGAGGVALGANEHHRHDKDLTPAEKDLKREHKHELTEEERHRHDVSAGGSSSHHHGRDATGAGVTGTAAYEAEKHHDHSRNVNEPGYGSVAGSQSGGNITTGNGPAPNTTGPHSKDWENKLDPRVDSMAIPTGSTGSHATTTNAGQGISMNNRNAYIDPAARNNAGFVSGPGAAETLDTTAPGTQHHHGRDAVGVGLGGAGAYEAEKHHKDRDTVNQPGYSSTAHGAPGIPNTSHSHDRDTTGGAPGSTGASHHYGKDAAGAGTLGAGTYEADNHHKHDKDLSASEKDKKRELKSEQNDQKKHHGLFGFLHRDKSKKYTPEEEAEFDRQEREHHSHEGRDAALGTTAAGTAGYEAEKLHGGHGGTDASDTMKPLPTAPGNHGVGTGPGTQNALIDRNRADYGNADSTGKRWEGGEGSEYAPPGTTLGDKLHGVERNRGVDGATGGGAGGTQHSRLHKDPPSSHPASQGGVTADGKYIEPGTGRATQGGYGSGTTGNTGATGAGYDGSRTT